MTIRNLQASGWRIEQAAASRSLPEKIRKRYPFVPPDYEAFATSIRVARNADETAWFLSVEDFAGTSAAAFTWDEFEQQSLEATAGDEDWAGEIRRFWDNHLPILLSVKSGYAFFALDAELQVVFGREPEYETVSVIARSFADFVDLVASGSARLPAGVL